MLAYHILCHTQLNQVARQLESLYSTDDVFLVDIDDGQNPDTSALNSWSDRPNVHIRHDANIGWGGAGTLRKTLQGAFDLLELDDHWIYYIVLSGQDLPLKNNTEIRQRLSGLAKTGTNCIRGFSQPAVETQMLPVMNKTLSPQRFADRGHTRLYALPGVIEPQTTFAARWRVEVVELAHQSQVLIRPCTTLLTRRREEFFARYEFWTGANWFNLHRSLLEAMHDDPFTYELYEVLSTTFIPDESFFQTYIHNSRFKDTVDSDHTRLIMRPAPRLGVRAFTMQDWPLIESSNALFGRKFDMSVDAEVIQRVLAGRHITVGAQCG